MSDEREHSELSLSDSDRWVNCPGAIFLSRKVGKQEAGPEAKRGTHVHELCAVKLEDFLQYKLEGTDPNIRATLMEPAYKEEEIVNADSYVEIIWKEILNQSITNKAWGIEERFTFDEHLDIFGTVDFWVIYYDQKGKRAVALVDYKNGFKYVDEKCGQVRSYACAIRREIRESGKDVDYVRTAIFQPRCVSAAPFRSATFTGKQLDVWEKRMYKSANQIYVKQKPKFKCGSWCRWCSARAICPAYTKSLEDKSSLALVTPREIKLPEPATLSDEVVSKLITSASMIEDFLGECKSYGLQRHAAHKPLPGLKVVLGSTKRKWISDEEKIIETLKELQVKDIFQEPKLTTITAVEKQIGKNKLDGLTDMTTPKPVLVPLSDARVEVKDGISLLSEVDED